MTFGFCLTGLLSGNYSEIPKHLQSKGEPLETAEKQVFTGRMPIALPDTQLTVPPTQRSTLGDCSFPTAAARSWNRLPASIRNASSVVTFRRHLKNHLFHSSFYVN